ncbi:MAG: hypothetical protein PHQ39_07095, partial [Methanothrix soehngenii]|nr:hypothetical protein [Methanothrix soehngenii]
IWSVPKIRDQIGPPGQPTCSDDLQRSQSCWNIGLRSAKDGFKSCFDRTLSGKSLAEPYRISIKRFTARLPKMPKYNTGDGFDMLNMYAEHSESNGWGTLLPGLKTEASAAPTPRSDL